LISFSSSGEVLTPPLFDPIARRFVVFIHYSKSLVEKGTKEETKIMKIENLKTFSTTWPWFQIGSHQ
jgi:hypothetical protein